MGLLTGKKWNGIITPFSGFGNLEKGKLAMKKTNVNCMTMMEMCMYKAGSLSDVLSVIFMK